MYSGCGCRGRLLVQHLHARHAFALLGGFDAIGQQHQARADLKRAKQLQAKTDPTRGQHIQVQRVAVKQVQEAVVGRRPEVQHAHGAGNAGVVGAAAQAGLVPAASTEKCGSGSKHGAALERR